MFSLSNRQKRKPQRLCRRCRSNWDNHADALTALLGRLPSDEPEETFRFDELTLPTDLPVTLPSKLIEQRPDVRQAEENLHAASAAAGVALANMLPQFTIDANIGSSALKLGQLFTLTRDSGT